MCRISYSLTTTVQKLQLFICRFVASDLQKFTTVLSQIIAVPIHSETLSSFLLPYAADASLTPLQESALQAVDVLQQAALTGDSEGGSPLLRTALAQLITLLLSFSEYACRAPKQLVDGASGVSIASASNQKTVKCHVILVYA